MPGYGQFYDDEIQGHSLSQGHCKDSVGTSASIRLLLLSSISRSEERRVGKECRSEERRVGKECDIPCRSRWSPDH